MVQERRDLSAVDKKIALLIFPEAVFEFHLFDEVRQSGREALRISSREANAFSIFHMIPF